MELEKDVKGLNTARCESITTLFSIMVTQKQTLSIRASTCVEQKNTHFKYVIQSNKHIFSIFVDTVSKRFFGDF